MAKKQKKTVNRLIQQARVHLTASKIAATDAATSQLQVLSKLADWHRRSDTTKWVIGEYLEG
jgi:hypothetical protein